MARPAASVRVDRVRLGHVLVDDGDPELGRERRERRLRGRDRAIEDRATRRGGGERRERLDDVRRVPQVPLERPVERGVVEPLERADHGRRDPAVRTKDRGREVADLVERPALDERHEPEVVDDARARGPGDDERPVERRLRDGHLERQARGGEPEHRLVLGLERRPGQPVPGDLEHEPPAVLARHEEVAVLVAAELACDPAAPERGLQEARCLGRRPTSGRRCSWPRNGFARSVMRPMVAESGSAARGGGRHPACIHLMHTRRTTPGGPPVSVGTAFHPRTAPLNRKMQWREWAGFYASSVYADFHDIEYNAIREAAAVIDVSPLYKYRLTGPDVIALADRVITRDATKLKVGQVYYTPWCDEHGKVIDDGTVHRVAEHELRWTAADPQYRWLTQNAAGLDVTVEDVTEELAALALQGPLSRAVLEAATGEDFSDLRYFRRRGTTIAGTPVDISRTGYTGDLGYELWIPADAAPRRLGRRCSTSGRRTRSGRLACSRWT